MDFADTRFGEFVGGLFPDLDLSDPQVQGVLPQLRVLARFVDEIFGVERAAKRAAAQAHTQTELCPRLTGSSASVPPLAEMTGESLPESPRYSSSAPGSPDTAKAKWA